MLCDEIAAWIVTGGPGSYNDGMHSCGKRRPTREELPRYENQTIPDVLGPNLTILFVGINPSLYSAATGHHFARPGNRFWPALYKGGLTDRLLKPAEGHCLPGFGCGITNIVARATARADQLQDDELAAGVQSVTSKVRRLRPVCVAFLGVTAYRKGFQRPTAKVGKQSERVAHADLYVLPNPSGLNAHYQLPDFAKMFAELEQAYY